MIKQLGIQSSNRQGDTQRTPIFHYYFSNLNVMNQKPTVPTRKIQELRLSNPHQSLEEHYSQHLEEELCLQHSCPIEYICFSCGDSVLCSQCMSTTSHLQHDIKNIERSKQFLKSQLQEWTIRLESKSQLLEVFYDQIRGNSADVHEFAQLYKERLSSQFHELIQNMRERLQTLRRSVDQFSNDYKGDCLNKLQKIRTRRLELNKTISIIKNKIDKNTVHHQAQYFSEKKTCVDKLLEEAEITFYKQQFVEPNWGIDGDSFKNIHQAINNVTVNFKFPQPYRDMFDIEGRDGIKKNTKKTKKELRLADTEKQERQSSKARYSNTNIITPFMSTLTPKNNSKDKLFKGKKVGDTLLKKRKKSSTKIVSMPTSPQKDIESSLKVSPSRSRKTLFRKKQQH